MAKMRQLDVDLLAQMALEVNEQDPIEFGKLAVGRQEAFKMVAASVLEQFDKEEYNEQDKIIMLSTITKLIVENMLLNIKVLARERDDKLKNEV